MSKIFIYHNPRWGKSRESVKILDNSGKDYEIIDYMNAPPSPDELKILADKMGVRARGFIRSRESIFKELDLQPHLDDDDMLFKNMSKHPRLIERPIVVKGSSAVLGRPPEKIEKFIST